MFYSSNPTLPILLWTSCFLLVLCIDKAKIGCCIHDDEKCFAFFCLLWNCAVCGFMYAFFPPFSYRRAPAFEPTLVVTHKIVPTTTA